MGFNSGFKGLISKNYKFLPSVSFFPSFDSEKIRYSVEVWNLLEPYTWCLEIL